LTSVPEEFSWNTRNIHFCSRGVLLGHTLYWLLLERSSVCIPAISTSVLETFGWDIRYIDLCSRGVLSEHPLYRLLFERSSVGTPAILTSVSKEFDWDICYIHSHFSWFNFISMRRFSGDNHHVFPSYPFPFFLYEHPIISFELRA
jgi:hypothetical protein